MIQYRQRMQIIQSLFQPWWQVLKRSTTDVRWYRSIDKKVSLWRSITFFTVMTLLINIIPAYQTVQQVFPMAQDVVSNAGKQLKAEFPRQAALEWDGEKLELRNEEYLQVPVPSQARETDIFPSETLAIIDTQVDSLQNLQETELVRTLDPLLAITADQLAIDTESGWETFALNELLQTVPPTTVDAASVDRIADEVVAQTSAFLEMVRPWSYVIVPLGLTISRMISLTIAAVLIWVIWLITGNRRSFRKLWQISLHVAVIAGGIHAVQQLALPDLAFSMYSVSFWIILTYVLLIIGHPQRS